MKKWQTIFFLLVLIFYSRAYAQTEAPPIYDTEGEEEYKDLAIEKERPKPAPKKPAPPGPEVKKEETPTPLPPQPPQAQPAPPQPATPPAETKPAEEMKVEQAKPIELPSGTATSQQPVTPPPPVAPPVEPAPPLPPPPPPPPLPVAPKEPEVPVPSNVAVVQIAPVTETPVNADGGPMKDAGGDISTALPVTYALYKENSISPTDTVDFFKFYTRANEGVAIVLTPEQASSQLACDILNGNGELLSQTKSANPGEPLSFQTTPFEKNDILYLRVADLNLLADSPPTEIRKYSMEFKPIAALIVPPASVPTATAELKEKGPEKETPGEKEEGKEAVEEELFEIDWFQYGLGFVGVLVIFLVLIIVVRKIKKKKEIP